jgi:hypothetical protein
MAETLKRGVVCSIIAIGSLSFTRISSAADAPLSFSTHIRPILSDKCVRCHGPDDATRQADLRLDQEPGVQAAFAGGDFAKSEAWRRLNSEVGDEQMPPPDSGKSLSAEDRAALRDWMESGAEWTPHWAFVRPQVREASLDRAAWRSELRNEIDYFVAERLNREGLAMSPEADKPTLIRRLSFDLTGLPPTPAQIDEFVADNSSQAYERLVERLLASPHYGEHVALDWLDGARYADTNGYQGDFERSMWPWRDWVIEAFNANMPFDKFAIEQLAGDLLPESSVSQKIATGFNRNHRTVTEDGSIDEEWRVENVVDRAETTSGVFLGLTMGCARCHDHKYDPITQREFYEFYAFFNSVDEKGVYTEKQGNVPPMIELPSEDDRRRLAEVDQRIQFAADELKHDIPDPKAEIETWLQQATSNADATENNVVPPIASLHDEADLAAILAVSNSSSNPRATRAPKAVEGLLGDAFEFAGSESIKLDDALQLDRNSPFTLAVWVKPRLKEESDIGAIISTLDEGDYRGLDVLVEEGGRLSVQLINRWPIDALKIIAQNPLPHDTWSHVVVSYDGKSKAEGLLVFVNGDPWKVDVRADTLASTIKTGLPLRIGSRSVTRYFRGDLADLMLFDRELTVSETDSLLRTALRRGLAQIDLDSAEQSAKLDQIAALLPGGKRREQARALDELNQEREAIVKSIPTVMVMQDLPTPRKTYLLKRGRYNTPDESEVLQPNVPAFLPPLPPGAARNRLTLAQWLVAPENPLTARVIVNRVWQRLFGTGLVKTSEDFGLQAEPPSHPELLDWLATSFIRNGWDLKQLQRTIVTSATYRQTSAVTPESYERDPENRLLGRGARLRLSAEMIRDNALAVSGLLTARIGGPSVMPYQPAGLWNDLAGGFQPPYVQSQGENLYRRSLYTFRKRTVSHPTLNTFDAPSWEVCALKRASTNTPLQALALLNDVTYAEAARKFAERMVTEGGSTLVDRIRFAFRVATARAPTDEEVKTLSDGFSRYLSEFRQNPTSVEKLLKVGESPTTIQHDRVELAAYAILASVMLNIDETIVKE